MSRRPGGNVGGGGGVWKSDYECCNLLKITSRMKKSRILISQGGGWMGLGGGSEEKGFLFFNLSRKDSHTHLKVKPFLPFLRGCLA